MRRTHMAAVLLALAISGATVATARDYDTGLGIIAGEPTGFTIKHMLSADHAIDGAIAWSYANDAHFHIHSDHLWHNWNVLRKAFGITEGAMPLYYGVGGRMKFGDDTNVGVRFPIGMAYLFDEGPFDIFFEIAPIMDFAPETELNLNGAIGMRYWF